MASKETKTIKDLGTAAEYTRAYKKRVADKREREDKYWTSMNGLVVVKKVSQCCTAH